MSADQPWWSRRGMRRDTAGHGRNDLDQMTATLPVRSPTPEDCDPCSVQCDGAMVARSQILVAGSTATLSGTLTNETGCDVHFSGAPPYALTIDSDGSRPVLLGDFNSPPRAQPSSADWVIHPGASLPYRSLPVTLRKPDIQWDGTEWSASSQSITLDTHTFSQVRLPMIQIIS